MLQAGDRVPHFEITTLDGARVSYADVWQRKNLLLVLLPDAESTDSSTFVSRLTDRISGPSASDTEFIISRDSVPGVPRPGVVVADRWSEVFFVASLDAVPNPDELVEWLRHVQSQCPECQGEAR